MDLDIDLTLEELDAPVSLAPPPMGEVLEPITPAAPAAPAAPDEAELRARIETCVDAALAAQIPALRERLVEAVMKAMHTPDRQADE